jgi:hypothetical protein
MDFNAMRFTGRSSEGFVRLICCCAMAIIVTAACGVAPGVAARFDPTSCEPTIVRDYRAPLKALPRVRALPPSGQLPFAPRNTKLGRLTRSILVGKVAVGFRFRSEASSARKLTLNWVVQGQVVRIDRRDMTSKIVLSRIERYTSVSRIQRVGMWLGELRVPGFYRVAVTFSRLSDGVVLGRYEEYARVVKPTTHVRLTPAVQQVSAGEKIDFRIENFGTRPVGAGEEFKLEGFANGGWVFSAASPRGPWLEALGLLRSGEAGMCQSFEVPPDLSPGRYRISKRIKVGGATRRRNAPFVVTAAAG